MTRVVVIFDVDREPSEFPPFVRGAGFLDFVENGIKFGVGDALNLDAPVRIVRSIVTGDPERVIIVNPQAPGHYLQLAPEVP